MSFYFKSRLAITAPDSHQPIATEDWKTACKADALPQPGTPDTPAPGVQPPTGSSGALGGSLLILLTVGALRRRWTVA